MLLNQNCYNVHLQFVETRLARLPRLPRFPKLPNAKSPNFHEPSYFSNHWRCTTNCIMLDFQQKQKNLYCFFGPSNVMNYTEKTTYQLFTHLWLQLATNLYLVKELLIWIFLEKHCPINKVWTMILREDPFSRPTFGHCPNSQSRPSFGTTWWKKIWFAKDSLMWNLEPEFMKK